MHTENSVCPPTNVRILWRGKPSGILQYFCWKYSVFSQYSVFPRNAGRILACEVLCDATFRERQVTSWVLVSSSLSLLFWSLAGQRKAFSDAYTCVASSLEKGKITSLSRPALPSLRTCTCMFVCAVLPFGSLGPGKRYPHGYQYLIERIGMF